MNLQMLVQIIADDGRKRRLNNRRIGIAEDEVTRCSAWALQSSEFFFTIPAA